MTNYPVDMDLIARRAFWRTFPPRCPYCASDDTWLFDTFAPDGDEFPVWFCNNPACPSQADTERQGFFAQDDLPGGDNAD